MKMSMATADRSASALAQEIRALELSFYEIMIAKDFDAMRDILSEDLEYIHSTGVVEGKDLYLEGVRDGLYEYSEIRSEEPDIRVFDAGAVTMGKIVMMVGKRGEPKAAVPLISTLVWIREGCKWRLRCRHATRLPA